MRTAQILSFMATSLATILVMAVFPACTGSRHGGPPSEKVFRVALEAKVTNLDPHAPTDAYSHTAAALFYEGLYSYHYLKKDQEVIPSLAAAMPTFSKDRKKLTIPLKKGVYFHDDPCFASTGGKGPEFTSADVVYFFERIASTKFPNPNWGVYEHRIVGIDDYHAGKTTTISGVKAVDAHTVEINLTQPLPRFVYNLVDTHAAMVPKECVQTLGEKLSTHPVGTGPFKIDGQPNLGSRIVAVRNPSYKHGFYPTTGKPGDAEKGLLVDAGKPLPFVDKVIVEIIVEQQPNWLKFKSGELDYASIPKDYIPRELPNNEPSEDLKKLGIQHFKGYRGDTTLSIFNMEDPVWGKKKELRQAYALALDVPYILAKQYENQAIQAHGLVAPTQYGYDATFKSKWSTRDVKKAKELLAKAGYPDGKGLPSIVQPTNEGALARQLDEMMSRQLAEVGIVLKAEPMTWPEFDKRIRTKNFTKVGMGMAMGTPDFDDVSSLVHSSFAETGQNSARYRNPEMDKLIDDIEAMDNGPARLAKIARVREILDEDLPYVPVAHRITHVFFQRWVKNADFVDRSRIGAYVKYLRVETAAEEKK